MTGELSFDREHWKETMTPDDKLAIRFPSAGASLSLGELSRGEFLPCLITESSEIVVSADYAYDLAIGKACRAEAMRAYARYLQTSDKQTNPALDYFALEHVYNQVISACACGIPQARMAEDLSNLRAYWLPRLCNQKPRSSRTSGTEMNATRFFETVTACGEIDAASREAKGAEC